MRPTSARSPRWSASLDGSLTGCAARGCLRPARPAGSIIERGQTMSIHFTEATSERVITDAEATLALDKPCWGPVWREWQMQVTLSRGEGDGPPGAGHAA